MLKYICGSVLSLVIFITIAYVPPTHAASADIIITQIQAGTVGSATQELVVIYNNSSQDVDISQWCLRNKSNISFACFGYQNSNDSMYLPAYSYATAATDVFATAIGYNPFTITYTPSNQSSGNIVGSSDTISLVTETETVIDTYSWLSTMVGGMVAQRTYAQGNPRIFVETNQNSDWFIDAPTFIPDDQTIRIEQYDTCPNIQGTQPELPDGYEIGLAGDCRPQLLSLKLSEILPNASGSDQGNEFIEIYNPNDTPLSLDRYMLWVGQSLEKSYAFPVGTTIEANGYLSFSNTQITFSLLNSSSQVRLTGEGEILDESPVYDTPDDNIAWAVINDRWQYTNQLTPGASNLPFVENLGIGESDQTTNEPQPCAANQYRSPETNRCRLIQPVASTPTPCKDGQYRSEVTNRCRNIASEIKEVAACSDDQERNPETGRCRKVAVEVAPTACKEGQERNPETNRCRTIKAMPKADYAVLGVQATNNNNIYVWLTIGAIILLALVYAGWEWRYELRRLVRKVGKFVRIRK
ncbi:MAG: lamin tail domain-containing protein [Candidatus Microsaccharimonas sp.]